MMTTGSVRGKMLGAAMQDNAGDSRRRAPPSPCQQLGQKRWRRCQSSSALAWPAMAVVAARQHKGGGAHLAEFAVLAGQHRRAVARTQIGGEERLCPVQSQEDPTHIVRHRAWGHESGAGRPRPSPAASSARRAGTGRSPAAVPARQDRSAGRWRGRADCRQRRWNLSCVLLLSPFEPEEKTGGRRDNSDDRPGGFCGNSRFGARILAPISDNQGDCCPKYKAGISVGIVLGCIWDHHDLRLVGGRRDSVPDRLRHRHGDDHAGASDRGGHAPRLAHRRRHRGGRGHLGDAFCRHAGLSCRHADQLRAGADNVVGVPGDGIVRGRVSGRQ